MSEPEPIPWPLPTPDDVAALLRARTKDADGHELGVFTDTTRPTADQVDELIALAYGDVSSQTGAYLDDRTAPAAQSMVALRAAMFVELSYFPEQVRSDRSAYPEYERLYTAGMTALGDAIDGNTAGSGIPRFASVPIMSATTAAYYSGMGSVWPEPENPANWPDPLFPPVSPVGDEPSHRARPLPSVPPLVIGLRGSVIRRRHGN
jgi:hypothetical protein